MIDLCRVRGQRRYAVASRGMRVMATTLSLKQGNPDRGLLADSGATTTDRVMR